MEIDIPPFVLFIIMICGFGLIGNIALFNNYKNRYIQRMTFMNKKLSEADDISSYRDYTPFKASLDFVDSLLPTIKEEYLVNSQYKGLVEEWSKRKKVYELLNWILIGTVTLFAAVTILFY